MQPLVTPAGRSDPAAMLNRVRRVLWWAAWSVLYRPSPRVLHAWRRLLLRAFGARVGCRAHPYPTARIWAPWNLSMGDHSCLGDRVHCYSVAVVTLGAHATVSQGVHLCTASHDYTDPSMPLVAAPISIGSHAWIAAEAFVGPGVDVGEGAIVGARAVVVRDVEPWTVVAGNPARMVKHRPELT